MAEIKPKMEYNAPFDIEYDILLNLLKNGDDLDVIKKRLIAMNDTDKIDILATLASIKNSIDNKSCEPVVIEVDKEVVKPIRHDVVVKEPVIKEVEKQVVVKEPVIKEVEKKIIQVVEKPVEKTVVKVVEKVVKEIVYKDRETIKYVDCRSGRVKNTEVIIHDKFPPVPKEITHDVNILRFKEQSLCLNEGITISSAIALPSWAHGKRSIDFKSMTNNEFKACVDWMVELSKHNNGCCGQINGGNRFKIYKLASRRV